VSRIRLKVNPTKSIEGKFLKVKKIEAALSYALRTGGFLSIFFGKKLKLTFMFFLIISIFLAQSTDFSTGVIILKTCLFGWREVFRKPVI